MSPFSQILASSLRNLGNQIDKAQAVLQKTPGAWETFVGLDKSQDGESYLGCVRNKDGHATLVVQLIMGGEMMQEKRLADIPCAQRIEAAALIPEFFSQAKAAEENVQERADDTAIAIEQAIAENC